MPTATQSKTRALAPGQVLRVYGMRRSGNHALINWIFRNADQGRGLFLNACKPGQDPLRSAQSIGAFQGGQEQALRGMPNKLDAAGPAPFTVVSFEDVVAPEAPEALFDAPEQTVIIYRSFLQWSASLLRKIQGNRRYGALDRSRVMMVALNKYNLMLGRLRDDATAHLLYDAWVSDESYRADALKRLGLPGTDLSRGDVQRFGGGSSFQDMKTQIQDLKTHNRSAAMADDLEYKLLLWTAARDVRFMERLATHFPEDADRVMTLGDTAKAKVHLP